MSKVRLNHIDWKNYDELDELYDDSMELIQNKKRKNGKFKENENDRDFHQPQWVYPVGERVIVISVNEEKQEVKVTDPFDREWIVPISYVKLN